MITMKDRVALIVGGTGGIGAATAIQFARAGANVVLAGRNEQAAKMTIAAIRSAKTDAVFIRADVTRSDEMERLVAAAVEKFGRLDCAFNNAGWEGVASNSADIGEEDWLRMMDVKLNGAWRSMKYQVHQMLKQGGGSIVNMAGNWGLVGFPRYASYCAAAHGVMGLTRAAALEYAGNGIRINAVCPGAVDAPMLDRMVAGSAAAKVGFASTIPMGRLATPDDVAQAVLWLCSDLAPYVTGQAIVLTGGG